jgi:hypothetical protein
MAREQKPVRVFVKDGPDGELTRQVNSAAGEVNALYDGFVEKTSNSKPAAGSRTSAASASS